MKMLFPGRWPPTALLLVFASALSSTGCGSDTIRVRGRLVSNGEPYAVDLGSNRPDIFALDFHGTVEGKRYVFPASVNPDGTFTVGGSEGKGIPRGQYRVSVMHSRFEGAGGDKLKGNYSSAKTPLSVDISDSSPLAIDLGTGTVTK